MSNLPFRPVRGTDKAIQAVDINEGWVYFATDTGKIYIDTRDERIAMGSAGASIYFGTSTPVKDEDTSLYTIQKEDVDGYPKLEDLILNSDGGFYKIVEVKTNYFICALLSISGTGGGGGTGGDYYDPNATRPSIKVTMGQRELINGQEASIHVTASSDVDKKGDPIDEDILVTIILASGGVTYRTLNYSYETGSDDYEGEPGAIDVDIELGNYLKESATSTIEVYVTCENNATPQSKTITLQATTHELKLEHVPGYSATSTYPTSGFSIGCNVVGSITKVLKCYYDDELLESKNLSANEVGTISFSVPKAVYNGTEPVAKTATYGYHTMRIELTQTVNGVEKMSVTPLEFEIAVVDSDTTNPPVIWLGDYQSEYYAYDTIRIPFLVYDPANTSSVSVHLYKNGIELDSSPREITKFTEFSYWEIADAELDKMNNYSISCGEDDTRKTIRDIRFTVVADPNRDMTIENGNLRLNFVPTGRSNSEAAAKRKAWSYQIAGQEEVKNAQFDNFNWYNNGWYSDTTLSTTCLRVSNGATFHLPYETMEFGSTRADQQSHTLEMQFKVSNIQKYGNLITDVTRYQGDGQYYQNYLAQSVYSNYDAYLQAILSAEEYENLVFDKVEKVIQIENAIGGIYDNNDGAITGIVLGAQDAFFSNGTDIVSVNYVEDDLVNLSFVYAHELKLLYIYINGCITGVVKSSYDDTSFKITSGEFKLSSDICDIDLYKVRIYNTSLSVSQIVKNYAVDRKDVVTFDQNALAQINSILKESQIIYSEMISYNEQHEDEPLMPYIIFSPIESNGEYRLPWRKDTPVSASMEFVNVPLDHAYASGKLEQYARDDGLISQTETNPDKISEAIKTYYKHHCPSFTTTIRSDAKDAIELSVQGTSSQFYPRRNFKGKTKVKGNFEWKDNEELAPEKQTDDGGAYTASKAINLFMNKGPYAEAYAQDQKDVVDDPKKLGYEVTRLSDGWYLNNYTNATDRWTLKVDYMESSGSYNAGFANMVATAYTKHPLQDYVKADVLTNTAQLKPVVENLDMRWEDYRTSVQGFPVMAFWKHGNDYTFIGYYRMLLDKGSDEYYGFDINKKITNNLLDDEKQKDVTECWEFSNNARGFCSYRDPWNRVELSFKAPSGVANEYTTDGAPVVANSFEYRYHSKEDSIDTLYSFNSATQSDLDAVAEDLGLEPGSIIAGNNDNGADALLTTYANWEKAVKWVWSTNLDAVASQGTYKKVPVGEYEYVAGQYYSITANGDYEIDNEPFDAEKIYYKKGGVEYGSNGEVIQLYEIVAVTTKEYLFEANKFYYLVSGSDTESADDNVYSLATEFDAGIDYYEFKSISDETELNKMFDLLVAPATGEYSAEIQYYTKNNAATINKGSATGAIVKVSVPNEEDFNAGLYYVASPVTYGKTTYTHDTKEYRADKFVNEFEKHFDPEYVATFFVMTEVIECYDSRGKNCMMASWGPLEEGGEYIWYPIFYDIDTQLGINNTGIPSFTYNVDATEDGNFSTSDSILWNNFYKFFKTTWIVPKYANLRGTDSKFDKLSMPPLASIDNIEKWYNFDYSVTKNLACSGQKPLIATNLDQYFKYITITNDKAKSQNVAHLNDSGEYAEPDSGTYFYALQGDRSQSRRQFLSSRLEYIDSWLNQGNYARGGANRLWGRISANNTSSDNVHSDKWVEDATHPYWVDDIAFGTKTHEFDAEYWFSPTPVRSCYVTAGDDSANYPSKKYDGINKMYFTLNELENGIRTSKNYPEQLLYLYGTNQMADFGDLSKLYWTEFKIEGEANKMTRLKLGHDGTTYDYKSQAIQDAGGDKTNITWYNKKLNGLTIPNKLPLLKEANFSNIGFSSNTSIDLSNSEKLENFRATGAGNVTSVKFAEGVALNTLYLPNSVTTLTLVEANLLTDLIKGDEYEVPKTVDGELQAKPGLYLEGFFDTKDKTADSKLSSVVLKGGSLGYYSYSILEQLAKKTSASITMTNVNWCPYTQLTEGSIYNSSNSYYKDNGHYGFESYEYTSDEQFNADVLSGNLYIDEGYGGRTDEGQFSDTITHLDDSAYEVLTSIQQKKNFTNGYAQSKPEITGIIYFDNDTVITEEDIETLQKSYPNVTFFFKTVGKAYSARFVVYDDETLSESYVKWQDGSSRPSVLKIQNYSENVYFDSPFELFKPEKTHYDFKGWSLKKNPSHDEIITTANNKWSEQALVEGQYDYVYYAIFEIHSYDLSYYANGVLFDTITLPYGSAAQEPVAIPYKDSSELPLLEAYDFVGWSMSETSNKLVNVSDFTVSSNLTFYAVFNKITNIREVIHEEWFSYNATSNGYSISPKFSLSGKVTLPATYKGQPITSVAGFSGQPNLTHIFVANGCKITKIDDEAFKQNNNFIYFDFTKAPISRINASAFQGCSLDSDLFALKDTSVQFIGMNAFNQAFKATNGIINIIIPGTITEIYNAAFSYQGQSGDTINFIIGSKEQPFDAAFIGMYNGVFSQNPGNHTATLYTSRYSSLNDYIDGTWTLEDAFGADVAVSLISC